MVFTVVTDNMLVPAPDSAVASYRLWMLSQLRACPHGPDPHDSCTVALRGM